MTYVVDAGDRLQFVQHRHREQEGVSTDELHGIAVSNLERLAEEKLTVRECGLRSTTSSLTFTAPCG